MLGDESGYTVGEAQQTKMAAHGSHVGDRARTRRLEADRRHQRAGSRRTTGPIEIPYVMGLIGTRSISKQIPGIHEIKAKNRERIVNGITAVTALETLRKNRGDEEAKRVLEATQGDLGFGLLLKKYTTDVRNATPEMIDRAMHDTVPKVTPMFWSFRIMVGLGFAMLLLFGLSFWSTLKSECRARPLAAARRGADAAGALDRQRTGLGGGRVRPPALDDLRRAAHAHERLHAQRQQPVRLAGRLHRLLHGAADRRDLPDAEVRTTRSGVTRNRALPVRTQAHA